eukprot:GEMP01003614.1.p1 GENE.GEMP01003614.1~~GEMP01003614.1.p1  ORF type:complete len:495 (+),score=108.94 GEMP01003614.1:960-2444(+)
MGRTLKRSLTPNPSEKKRSRSRDVQANTVRSEQKDKRDQLGMLRSPLRTLGLMTLVCQDYMRAIWGFLITNNFVRFAAVPALAAWVASKYYLPDLHKGPADCVNPWDAGVLWTFELYIYEALWWILLGILSSVGFGTGLHSGLMFLFPHIMKVVFAADACGTLDGLITMYEHPCKLDCTTTTNGSGGAGSPSDITFFSIFLRISVPCMLWGFGTAAGELPPYAVSKAARLAGKSNEEFDMELEEAKQKMDPISRMKVWTIGFTEKYGFMGVLALSAWPNAAFDMCGMCCGYLLMPFWTFFAATLIGKGLIKVNGQAVFFILLFGRTFFENVLLPFASSTGSVISTLIGTAFNLENIVRVQRTKVIKMFEKQTRYTMVQMFGQGTQLSFGKLEDLYSKFGTTEEVHEIATRVMNQWDADGDNQLSKLEVEGAVSATDRKISLGSLDPSTKSTVGRLWEIVIVGLICFFLISIIDQLAVAKQREIDEQKSSKKKRS